MQDDLRPAALDEVISSITYAIAHKGPKACRIQDDRQRWRMAEEIADHLRLCGFRFFKNPPAGGFGYLLAGPSEGCTAASSVASSGAVRSGDAFDGDPAKVGPEL
jgi:hypothetical protein